MPGPGSSINAPNIATHIKGNWQHVSPRPGESGSPDERSNRLNLPSFLTDLSSLIKACIRQ
jgi:hypothetical protein